jgi:hypothetical protein
MIHTLNSLFLSLCSLFPLMKCLYEKGFNVYCRYEKYVEHKPREKKSIALNFYDDHFLSKHVYNFIELIILIFFLHVQLWMFDLYCNTDRFWHEISRTNGLCSQRSCSKVSYLVLYMKNKD